MYQSIYFKKRVVGFKMEKDKLKFEEKNDLIEKVSEKVDRKAKVQGGRNREG